MHPGITVCTVIICATQGKTSDDIMGGLQLGGSDCTIVMKLSQPEQEEREKMEREHPYKA